MKKLAFIVILLLACMGQAAQFGDLDITFLPMLSETFRDSHNMVLRFRVVNRGTQTANVSILAMMKFHRTNRIGMDDGSASRSVDVGGGASAELVLQIPTPEDAFCTFDQNGFRLLINGKKVDADDLFRSSIYNKKQTFAALATGNVDISEYGWMYMALRKSYVDTKYQFCVPSVSLAQWPANASEYMGFSHIWISGEETVPANVRKALDEWVFHGGHLIVVLGPDSSWPKEEPSGKHGVVIEKYGLGGTMYFKPVAKGGMPEIAAFKKAHPVSSNDELQKLNTELLKKTAIFPSSINRDPVVLSFIEDEYGHAYIQKPRERTNIQGLLRFDEQGIPLVTLIIICTIFAVLVGPVSYYYLRRHHREPLLLLTTPVLSLVFCIIVILFVTFGEGWGTDGKAYGFTYLDQKSKMAATQGNVSFLARMRPSEDLVFDTEENVVFYGSLGSIMVEDKPGIRVNPAVFIPRNQLHIQVDRVETRNERLRFIRTGDGAVEVVNGLGVELSEVLYCDGKGVRYASNGAIKEGKRAKLMKIEGGKGITRKQIGFDKMMEVASRHQNHLGEPKEMYNDVEENTFIAISREPLFYNTGMRPSSFECLHYVTGPVSEE